MNGLSRISAFGLALLISTLAVAQNAEPTAKAVQEERGFFSRLFGGGDSKPAERAETSRPAAESSSPAAVPAASQSSGPSAPARAEPEAKAVPQVAKASVPVSLAGSAGDPYQILKRADESRGNLQGIAWNVEIEANERGRTDTMLYDIKARGFNISGINIAPPKSKGQKLLMLDSNMWFHKPGLSKPIPISLRQKLMGQASYGDVASTNYAEDYDATLLPDETVEGVDCYVFDLKARNSKTTYDRIVYWVDKERLVGGEGGLLHAVGQALQVGEHAVRQHGEYQWRSPSLHFRDRHLRGIDERRRHHPEHEQAEARATAGLHLQYQPVHEVSPPVWSAPACGDGHGRRARHCLRDTERSILAHLGSMPQGYSTKYGRIRIWHGWQRWQGWRIVWDWHCLWRAWRSRREWRVRTSFPSWAGSSRAWPMSWRAVSIRVSTSWPTPWSRKRRSRPSTPTTPPRYRATSGCSTRGRT
ncbi:outer membrane lipoprotein-sorting protein [Azotobacter vinelandii]